MIDLIFDILPQIHGGGNHQGSDTVKGLEAFLSFIESLISKNPTEIFAAFMPGISALDNIHPLIVHFPIALFVLFFFADTIGGLMSKRNWRQFATPILYLGTITAIFTVIAGFQAAYSAPHNDATHAIMLRHQGFGISVTVLALLLSLRRYFADEDFLARKTYGHFALSALLMLFLSLGADLGGFMVYQHGVAVAPVMRANAYLQQSAPVQGHNYGSAAAHQHGDEHNHGSNESAHQHDENAHDHSHGSNEPAHQHNESTQDHSHGSNEVAHSHAAPQKEYNVDIAVPVEILYEQAAPAHTHDHGEHGHNH